MLATSTPVTVPGQTAQHAPFNEQVKQRNDEVFRLAQHHDLAVDDLYAAAKTGRTSGLQTAIIIRKRDTACSVQR